MGYEYRELDNKFVVPLIYTLITIAPSIISYLRIFGSNEESASIKTVLPMMILGLIVTIKAPVALGIYFITSGIFNLIEILDLGYIVKIKCFHKQEVFKGEIPLNTFLMLQICSEMSKYRSYGKGRSENSAKIKALFKEL